jgi:hypothetical protein
MIFFAGAMILPCLSASPFSSMRVEAAGIDVRVEGSIKDAGEVVDLQSASPVIDGEQLEIGSCIGAGSPPKVIRVGLRWCLFAALRGGQR